MSCKEVWLKVASGGRWTAAEIRQEVPTEGRGLERALYSMTKNGMLTMFPGTPVKYGVTSDCITPRMTSVAEMLEAMGVAS